MDWSITLCGGLVIMTRLVNKGATIIHPRFTTNWFPSHYFSVDWKRYPSVWGASYVVRIFGTQGARPSESSPDEAELATKTVTPTSRLRGR